MRRRMVKRAQRVRPAFVVRKGLEDMVYMGMYTVPYNSNIMVGISDNKRGTSLVVEYGTITTSILGSYN